MFGGLAVLSVSGRPPASADHGLSQGEGKRLAVFSFTCGSAGSSLLVGAVCSAACAYVLSECSAAHMTPVMGPLRDCMVWM